MGGKQFILPCKLSRNGCFIKTTALIDSGANVFGVMNSQLAVEISRAFNLSFRKLPLPFHPIGFDGKTGTRIERIVILILSLDQRRISFPFLITDLGSHDIIIGRKFLAHYDILVRPQTR